MTITMLPIEKCFSETEIGIIPTFDFLDTESPDFRFMRMQPKGHLTADSLTGVKSSDPSHLDKCREALSIAHTENVDLFMTPEYSIPIILIKEIINNQRLQPPPKKLWCLCCEGITYEEFNENLNQWSDYVYLGKRSLDDITINSFVGVMLYIFQSQEGDKICIVPQSKFQPMREDLHLCERIGLSRGKHIVLFGEQLQNRLASIICADAYHPDIKDSHIFFPNGIEQKYIILHPQLNSAPRNGEISALRNNIFGEERGQHTIYITANWAVGTSIALQQMEQPVVIRTPWSSIYRRYINFNGEPWNQSLLRMRQENFNYGLGFGFERYRKYKVWYAHKLEHIHILLIRKPFGGGPELIRPSGTVQAIRSLIPNEVNDNWINSNLTFDRELPSFLVLEANGDYEFPIRASIDDRDRFFSYCLGQREEDELWLHENELSYRSSYHIDDACESLRERKLMNITKLIRFLKRLEQGHFPSQLQRIKGGFKFNLVPKFPINVVSKSPYEKDGALVIYVEREMDMKQKVEQMIQQHGEFIMETRVCVFSTSDITGEIIYYPVLNDDWTVSDRVEQTTEYTQGGLSIEQSDD